MLFHVSERSEYAISFDGVSFPLFFPLILQVQVKYCFLWVWSLTLPMRTTCSFFVLPQHAVHAPMTSFFRLDSNYLCVLPRFQLHWEIFKGRNHFLHLCISTPDQHKMLIHCLVNKEVEKKILVAVIRKCSQVYLLKRQVIPRLVLGAQGVLLQARWAFWVCYNVCLKGIWQVLKTKCLKVKFTFLKDNLGGCPGSAEKGFLTSSSSLAVFQLCSAQVHRRPGFLAAGT